MIDTYEAKGRIHDDDDDDDDDLKVKDICGCRLDG